MTVLTRHLDIKKLSWLTYIFNFNTLSLCLVWEKLKRQKN